MSDDERHEDGASGEAGGPGMLYQPFVIMEELLDKLKLLHYEDGYCRQLGMKPFSRFMFTIKFSPVEFFFRGIILCTRHRIMAERKSIVNFVCQIVHRQ